jgi:cytochrome P450
MMNLPPTVNGQELLFNLGAIQKDTLGYLMSIASQKGDVVRFEAGPVAAYFLNQPEAVKHVLQDNHHNYTKNTIQYNALATITGRGLLTSDGPEWFKHRRMEQPAFARTRLMTLDQVVMPAVERMVSGWRDGGEIDVDGEMMRLALEIVGKALFGVDLSREARQLTQAVITALDHIVHRARSPLSLPDFFPTPENIRFKRAVRTLDLAVQDIIAARQTTGELGEDMLGMLLKARDENGQPLSDQQVRDEVITLLIAGHETSASALTWSWYLLAQNPAAWQTMRQEVENVLGGRRPGCLDLENLAFTGRVFSETLRLYPPAWLITRRAIEADQISGYDLPPKALVILSPYTLQRNKRYWEDPEQFLPQRFEAARTEGRPRYAYVPFGGGPRLCIGSGFAQIESQLILAAVTQNWRLELPENQPAVKADALVTIRPRGGLVMRVRSV